MGPTSAAIISALLLPLLLQTAASSAGGKLDEVCRAANATWGVSDYDTCMGALGADPRSEGAGFNELGLISAQLCLADAIAGVNKIRSDTTHGNYTAKAKECLGRCSREVVKPQVRRLAAAVDAYRSGNFSGAAAIVQYVSLTSWDCGYVFIDCPELPAYAPYNLAYLTVLARYVIEQFGNRT